MDIHIDVKRIKALLLPLVSEVSLYFFLFYIQYLFNVGQAVEIAGEEVNFWGGEVNIWASAALLWVLINATVLACPVFSKYIFGCRGHECQEHHKEPASKESLKETKEIKIPKEFKTDAKQR